MNNDVIACYECGRKFKSLSGHVFRAHQITLSQYRKKYGLALTNPLVAADVREKAVKAGLRRRDTDPRVHAALTGEGAQRGREAGIRALRQPRSPETCERIAQWRRREGDALVMSKLHAKGFTSLAQAAQWAQHQGMSWNQMCQHLGTSFTATKLRARREGITVWKTMPPKAQAMLDQARDHVANGGTLAATSGELSTWLTKRRWWTKTHDDGGIERELDTIDPDWRHPH